jgi:glycosyltransferase involved in cell wall biosynthesis
MAKISVLHVLSTDRFSGAEKVALQICRNLNRDSFDVRILCNGGELLRRYRKEGLNAFDVNANRFYPWNVAAFARIVRTYDVDIVHAHGARASVFALVCRAFTRRRYRIVSHIHGSRRWRRNKGMLSAVDRFLVPRCDMNVVCGAEVYGHFMKGGNPPDASKVCVIANALEIERAAGRAGEAEYIAGRAGEAERAGGPAAREAAARDDFVFGFVGRFSKPKGLVPFFSKIIESGDVLDGARLVMIGDGAEMKTLRKMAAESGLARRIVFEGARDDALDRMRDFDVLVLPSISEGLPMVVLEAMSAAKPVLAFDVGSVSEALRDGVNGRLVTAGDYDAFLGQMRWMKDHRKELAAWGQNGGALLAAEFGIDAHMEKIEELYRNLSRGGKSERPSC